MTGPAERPRGLLADGCGTPGTLGHWALQSMGERGCSSPTSCTTVPSCSTELHSEVQRAQALPTDCLEGTMPSPSPIAFLAPGMSGIGTLMPPTAPIQGQTMNSWGNSAMCGGDIDTEGPSPSCSMAGPWPSGQCSSCSMLQPEGHFWSQ